MKIGILTLHEADNYGAVLQAYALQQVLGKLGADSEFLSFTGAGRQAPRPDSGASGPLIRRIRLEGERRSALFGRFRQERLVCAPPCPWPEATELGKTYDRFIVGSDQVWNPRIPGVDERYFLPFAAPEKRFSYAASFGAEELPDRLREWCGRQLAKFRGLSVREESGRCLIGELTGRDAAVCLDPTLLLSPEDWERLTAPVEGPPYALLFLLKNDAQLASAAKESASQKGLELRVVTGAFLPQFGFESWSGVDVERWLSLIRGAACVFTNSFHGAAFSLLFGRPLAVNRLSDGLSARNGRIEELLSAVGMEDAFQRLCSALPAAEMDRRLEQRRNASIRYLKEIVCDAAV